MNTTRRWSTLVLFGVLMVGSAAGQEAENPLASFTARVSAADPERAWQAVVELGALDFGGTSKKKLDTLAGSWKAKFQASEGEEARVLLAHALGALREHGGAAAPELGKAMASDPSPAVRMACTLALVRCGGEGAKASLKHFSTEDLVGASLACAVVAATKPSKGLARLEKAAEECNELRGYVLSEPALLALDALGEGPADYVAVRKDKLLQLRVPRGPLNWAGFVPSGASGFLIFGKMLGETEPLKEEEFVLPQSLRCSQSGRALDVYTDALGQLVRLPDELHPALRDGKFATWNDYRLATERWQRTIKLLMEVDAKLLPKE